MKRVRHRRRCGRMLVLLYVFFAAAVLGQSPASKPRESLAAFLDDLSVWPNRISYRNSDPWLCQNHEKIRKMRPRVLVLNFANDVNMASVRDQTTRIIRAIAESTRYHGFKDPAAPAFLEYQVVKYIDMRDKPVPRSRARDNSSLFPAKSGKPSGVLCDYGGFYTDEFAKRLGFVDPHDPTHCLNLHDLINAGLVHELWFFADHRFVAPALEVVELKQYYDENCRPIEGTHGPAGNGHDQTMPWSGRSFRIAFFNPHRGVGCALENFGHALEGMANHNAIAYFRKYFAEFAELDLDSRYGLPFNSLYALASGKHSVTYPSQRGMEIFFQGRMYRVEPYIAFGGNVHFPPGARRHYDTRSQHVVLSVIENYRQRNGPDGRDLALPFRADKFARYETLAPDCMGPWTIFWRQCMPGLDNRCVDDEGRPMKNWWVFLFY